METYIQAKELVHHPDFFEQRQKTLSGLDLAAIDEPIIELITRFGKLSYCFTLQCCYGHFLYADQTDAKNFKPLPDQSQDIDVDYRIAYLAVCVQNNEPGRELLQDLRELTTIDPENIQFGSAQWFWDRQKNSYIVQVEPERYKTQDRCVIDYREAKTVERVRNRFFDELERIVGRRI